MGSAGYRYRACLEEKRKSCDPRRERRAHVEEPGQVGGRAGRGVRRPGSRCHRGLRRSVDRSCAEGDEESQTPIVFLHPNDPVRDGLVESLANPGRISPGSSAPATSSRSTSRYFTLLIPDTERILALVNPEDSNYEYLLTRDPGRGQAARSRAGGPRGVGSRGHPARLPVAAGRTRSTRACCCRRHSDSTIRRSPSGSGSVRACRCRRIGRTGWSRGRSSPTAPTCTPSASEAARYVDGILDGADPSELSVKEIRRSTSPSTSRLRAGSGSRCRRR